MLPERRTPGARGRIGIIQPAPGVMLEYEWPRWLPPEILFLVGRIRMNSATAEGYAQIAATAPDTALDLAAAGADVIAYACTIGSLYDGVDAEKALLARLTAASGKTAISLGETSVAALRASGASRLAIMTPYTKEVNAWIERYLAARGFAVEGFIATPVSIATVGDLQPAEVAKCAVDGLAAAPNADALWIPCTAIQTMDVIAAIEAITGRPVVSGVQALLWRALNILGVTDPIRGAGRLFAIRSKQEGSACQ